MSIDSLVRDLKNEMDAKMKKNPLEYVKPDAEKRYGRFGGFINKRPSDNPTEEEIDEGVRDWKMAYVKSLGFNLGNDPLEYENWVDNHFSNRDDVNLNNLTDA